MSNAEMERLLDRPMAITRREYNADMLTASKMGNAAAVAEARVPLVEALRDCHALLQDAHYEYDLLGRNFCGPDVAKVIEAAAAALAKETPDA
jgi:hypothetical protein